MRNRRSQRSRTSARLMGMGVCLWWKTASLWFKTQQLIVRTIVEQAVQGWHAGFCEGKLAARTLNSECMSSSWCHFTSKPFDDRDFQNSKLSNLVCNDVVTCALKLFQNYFSLRRRPSEIILPKAFQNCFPTCSVSLK